MKNVSRLVLIIGIACLAFGIYGYGKEEYFIRRSAKTVAKIDYVRDEPVTVTTEGTVGGPSLSFHHVCHYAITFNAKHDEAIKTELTSIGRPCLRLGSSIPIVYDPLLPQDSVRNPTDAADIHTGIVGIIFGLLLIFANYLDWKKFRIPSR